MNACVYPISPSERNLSDPTGSRTSFIGVNTGASASSTVETLGELESGGVGTVVGLSSPDDEEESRRRKGTQNPRVP